MPIRRLNYTKRKKLKRSQIRIRLSPNGNGEPRTFEADLTLPTGLPDDARVFVEAYRSSPAARMRFDFGTVAAIQPPPPEQRRLHEFQDDLPPLFRVKVTDTGEQLGKLLADAHQIRPVDPDEQPDKRQGILLIHHKPLEGLVWELDPDGDPRGPILWIDEAADPDNTLGRQRDFASLVYPEVLRQILRFLLIEDPDQAEGVEWAGHWLRFSRTLPGMAGNDPPPDTAPPEDKKEWIDRAVRAFAKHTRMADIWIAKEEDA